MKACILQAVLRDARNGAVGDFPFAERELHARSYAEIEVVRPLRLVDLRADGCIRMGVPTDVVRTSAQGLARDWSLAFHGHPAQPGGIVYPSRLNGQTNLAIYDRAVGHLRPVLTTVLAATRELPAVLDELKVAIVA